MTAAQSFGTAASPFTFKQEKDDCSNEEDDDENDDEEDDNNDDDEEYDDDDDDDDDEDDATSVSSLTLPSILDKESFEYAEPTDEFLRLTSMVRRVYFSYLHKSIIGNYNVCWQEKEKQVTKLDLKKFASRMELCAVKASLEASLYRQSMLKMISDIKSNTSSKRTYKKLQSFLETPSNVSDVAVQTNEERVNESKVICESDNANPDKDRRIQSAFVTSNSEEKASQKVQSSKNLDDRIKELLKNENSSESTRLKISRPEKSLKMRKKTDDLAVSPVKRSTEMKKSESVRISEIVPGKTDKDRRRREPNAEPPLVEHRKSTEEQLREILEKDDSGGTMLEGSKDTSVVEKGPAEGHEVEEGSQDSLMRHLEDMFCESDDSSDLMTLIEKHSGVTKANIDSEIGKMCLDGEDPDKLQIQKHQSLLPVPGRLSGSRTSSGSGSLKESLEDKISENATSVTTGKRKLSFSNYKRMKKRAMGEPETPPHEETAEERQDRKVRGIWFVERVHQVSKLEAKMMELSMKNYRKHGRICAKFIELFGDPDEEEMAMPESPIRIEEHLTACKERIAPWVVKYLMPYYTKRIIDNRLLFKTVAKHITDMLIIENTFPEEDCVDAYIKDYFRNKTCIKAESDIYV